MAYQIGLNGTPPFDIRGEVLKNTQPTSLLQDTSFQKRNDAAQQGLMKPVRYTKSDLHMQFIQINPKDLIIPERANRCHIFAIIMLAAIGLTGVGLIVTGCYLQNTIFLYSGIGMAGGATVIGLATAVVKRACREQRSHTEHPDVDRRVVPSGETLPHREESDFNVGDGLGSRASHQEETPELASRDSALHSDTAKATQRQEAGSHSVLPDDEKSDSSVDDEPGSRASHQDEETHALAARVAELHTVVTRNPDALSHSVSPAVDTSTSPFFDDDTIQRIISYSSSLSRLYVSPETQEALMASTQASEILPHIYLGGARAFGNNCISPDLLDGFTPEIREVRFSHIITLATFPELLPSHHTLGCSTLKREVTSEMLLEDMSKNVGLTWHNLGFAADISTCWDQLVYACTCPSDPLLREMSPEDIRNDDNKLDAWRRQHLAKFNERLKAIPVQEHFSYVHELLTNAYRSQDDNILIHCLGGMSRSPTILATWIIKMGNGAITAQWAENFLKQKRSCVHSKFTVQLRAYYKALYPPRS